VRYGDGHTLITDEPASAGGDDAGPDPYTLLLAALGSCISMTTTLYARRKGWPLERVTVHLRQQRIHAADCQKCRDHDSERSVLWTGHLCAISCKTLVLLSSIASFGELQAFNAMYESLGRLLTFLAVGRRVSLLT